MHSSFYLYEPILTSCGCWQELLPQASLGIVPCLRTKNLCDFKKHLLMIFSLRSQHKSNKIWVILPIFLLNAFLLCMKRVCRLFGSVNATPLAHQSVAFCCGGNDMDMQVPAWAQNLVLRIGAKICCLFSPAKVLACWSHSQGGEVACSYTTTKYSWECSHLTQTEPDSYSYWWFKITFFLTSYVSLPCTDCFYDLSKLLKDALSKLPAASLQLAE